jgi:DNA-binding SARP family transcriptional activator
MHTEMLEQQRLLPPTMEPTEHLLVCLLGSFRFLRHGQPLNLLVTGKAMTLLAELALRLANGVPREELLETLWPEQDPVQSTVSLNSLVYSLQRQLRDNLEDGAALIYTNGCYVLNQEAGLSTDIARFDAHVSHGTRLAADGDDGAAAAAFQSALDLYRGDLSTGTNIYAVIERERLRASFLSVLAWLADRSYREGDDTTALAHALHLLTYDPCREDAHRVVMRIRVRRGERAQALRQYRLCEHVLRREFDVAPEALTRELFDQIRAGAALG